MRVLFVVGALHSGGLERQLYTLLQEGVEFGLDTSVAVWRHSATAFYFEKIRELQIPVYSVDSKFGLLGRLFNLRRLSSRLDPVVVHAYSTEQNFPALFACLGLRGKPVGSIRCDFQWMLQQTSLLRSSLSMLGPDLVIANSRRAVAEAKGASWSLRPREIRFVRNNIDPSAYDCPDCPPSERIEFVGVGRLATPKRWDVILEALARASACRSVDWRFRLYGDGVDRDRLQRQVHALGIVDRVELCGFCDDVRSAFSGAHAVLFASNAEGSPNSVLEAMACGRAVVANDVGDITSQITNNLNGVVVPNDRLLCESFAKAIGFLMDHPDTAIRWGAAAREEVVIANFPGRLLRDTLAAYSVIVGDLG